MKKKLMSLSVQNTCLPTYLLSLTFFLEVIKWDSTVLCFKSADLSMTILCHTFQLILDIHWLRYDYMRSNSIIMTINGHSELKLLTYLWGSQTEEFHIVNKLVYIKIIIHSFTSFLFFQDFSCKDIILFERPNSQHGSQILATKKAALDLAAKNASSSFMEVLCMCQNLYTPHP